jgi:hypothetical protein
MELSLVLLLELRLLAIALESLNGLSHALVGHPAFPFIGQVKAWVTAKGERRITGRKSPLGSLSASSPSCGSYRPYRHQQGQLSVVALSITSAMCGHRLPVMALHSVLVDVVVNRCAYQCLYKG